MNIWRYLAVLLAIFGAAPAMTQDLRGSSDHPLVGRYAGSRIVAFEQRQFDELTILTGQPAANASGAARWNAANSRSVNGKITRIAYRGPDGRSTLEIYANYRAQLASRGFNPLFECSGPGCYPRQSEMQFYATLMVRVPSNDAMFNGVVTANRTIRYGVFSANGTFVTLYVALNAESRPVAWIQVIEGQAMETGMVQVPTAAEMATALKGDGRLALYGIFFDTDQAVIKPESKATLDQIAALLRAEPRMNLVVTGHTDNTGDFRYNIQLSERRAAAVVDRLVSEYRIARSRLTPFGAGMAAPVASNATAEGRAKNRRVELVVR